MPDYRTRTDTIPVALFLPSHSWPYDKVRNMLKLYHFGKWIPHTFIQISVWFRWRGKGSIRVKISFCSSEMPTRKIISRFFQYKNQNQTNIHLHYKRLRIIIQFSIIKYRILLFSENIPSDYMGTRQNRLKRSAANWFLLAPQY